MPSAAAIAEISGFMKKASLAGVDVGAQAVRSQFVRHRRSDRGDRRLRQPVAQPRLAAVRPRDLDQPADLARIGQRNRIDAALRHLVDRGDDVGVGGLRVIDVRQHGIDLGALRLDRADQRAVILVRIKLQADAMAAQIEARQHLGDAFGCRLLRRHLRLQPDFAQRPAGLWAAREFSRLAERGDELLLDADPPHHLHQPAQAFAGHQHQIVAGLVDEAPDPGLDRRGSGASWMVNIGHCRTSAPCSASRRENCASSRVSRIRMR